MESTKRLPGKLTLHYMPMSAPCRSVMLTAAALGIKLDLKILDLMKAEHLQPDFLMINPQHCIPTLNDEGFVLWESRAICAYLVNMYGKDDKMYPRDPRKRAIVDARLDFDQSTLYQRFYNNLRGIFDGKAPTEEAIKLAQEGIDMLDKFLSTSNWIAGDHYTIADFALLSSITSMEGAGENVTSRPHVKAWLERARKEIPGFQAACQDGADQFRDMYTMMKGKLDRGEPIMEIPQQQPKAPGKLTMYYVPISPPCRSVMLTAASLGIKLDLKLLDAAKEEHLQPEFRKINPQHCIPTIDDDGFVLWESRAICAYLVNMYGKDDKLYPRDPKKRALVDARLDFDMGTLYQRFYVNFKTKGDGKTPTEEAIKQAQEAVDLLDGFLSDSKWAAGDHYTIADLALLVSVRSMEATGEDLSSKAHIQAWLAQARKEVPEFDDFYKIVPEMFQQFIAAKAVGGDSK